MMMRIRSSRSHAPRGNVSRAAPRRVSILAALILSYGAVSTHASDDPSPNRAGIVKSQLIYEKAPFPECHASTIVESNGGLLAGWFGGTEEGNRDVGVWLSRNIDGRWTDPVEVANGI